MLNRKKTLLAVLISLGVWALGMLCAAAIAEGEVLEQYRRLVYLGTALALLLVSLGIVLVRLVILSRLQKRIRRTFSLPAQEQALALQALTGRYRSAGLRALISVNLSFAYLRMAKPLRSYSLLELLSWEKCFFFPKQAFTQAICLCALGLEDPKLFAAWKGPAQRFSPQHLAMLPGDYQLRLKQWQQTNG